jgi:hypothetical protein
METVSSAKLSTCTGKVRMVSPVCGCGRSPDALGMTVTVTAEETSACYFSADLTCQTGS